MANVKMMGNPCAVVIAETPEEAKQLYNVMNGISEPKSDSYDAYILLDQDAGEVLEDECYTDYDEAVEAARDMVDWGGCDTVEIYGLTHIRNID